MLDSLDNTDDIKNSMFKLEDAAELHKMFDFSVFRYAPMFYNIKNNIYYTTTQMQCESEKEAMEKGDHMAEFAKGMNNSSKFTEIVVDLEALKLWPGIFVGEEGSIFPVIIIEWDKLH